MKRHHIRSYSDCIICPFVSRSGIPRFCPVILRPIRLVFPAVTPSVHILEEWKIDDHVLDERQSAEFQLLAMPLEKLDKEVALDSEIQRSASIW